MNKFGVYEFIMDSCTQINSLKKVLRNLCIIVKKYSKLKLVNI
jgi:hypothetical protein